MTIKFNVKSGDYAESLTASNEDPRLNIPLPEDPEYSARAYHVTAAAASFIQGKEILGKEVSETFWTLPTAPAYARHLQRSMILFGRSQSPGVTGYKIAYGGMTSFVPDPGEGEMVEFKVEGLDETVDVDVVTIVEKRNDQGEIVSLESAPTKLNRVSGDFH